MATERYTAQEVINALREANGIQTAAARILGCHRGTVANYIERYVTVREAYEEQRDVFIDKAEHELIKKVNGGDLTAIMFVLKTIGKYRGYVDRHETRISIDDLNDMTDDDLHRIATS